MSFESELRLIFGVMFTAIAVIVLLAAFGSRGESEEDIRKFYGAWVRVNNRQDVSFEDWLVLSRHGALRGSVASGPVKCKETDGVK